MIGEMLRYPRLRELLFAAAPAYNWLPEGDVPIGDFSQALTAAQLAWLKRWGAYYRLP